MTRVPPACEMHLADGLLARPQRFREVLVDDHRPLAGRGVAGIEVAPGLERNLHRLQVARVDDAGIDAVALPGRIADAKRADTPGAIAAERQHVAQPCRFDAGKRGNLGDGVVEVLVGLRQAVELPRRVHAPGHRVLRLEPELDVEERA